MKIEPALAHLLAFDNGTLYITADGILKLVELTEKIPAGQGGLLLAQFLNLVVDECQRPVLVKIVKEIK